MAHMQYFSMLVKIIVQKVLICFCANIARIVPCTTGDLNYNLATAPQRGLQFCISKILLLGMHLYADVHDDWHLHRMTITAVASG